MIRLGVMGDQRAEKSLSPRMHNAALAARGLAGLYITLPVRPEEVGSAVAGLKALGFAGANVTVPHKQAVVPFMDKLEGEAATLQAVNTIVIQDGRFIGRNTDVAGCAAALGRAGADMAGARALVVGAGGAARAVVLALVQGGAHVDLAGRTLAKAREITEELGGSAMGLDQAHAAAVQADIIINASAVTAPAEGPELAELVGGMRLKPDCRLVMDINYGRRENIWRDLADRHGAAFCDGLPMLAGQAALSFNMWTNGDGDLEEFLRAAGERR